MIKKGDCEEMGLQSLTDSSENTPLKLHTTAAAIFESRKEEEETRVKFKNSVSSGFIACVACLSYPLRLLPSFVNCYWIIRGRFSLTLPK